MEKDKKTQVITFRFTKEEMAKLERLANEKGISKSEVLRKSLDFYLDLYDY